MKYTVGPQGISFHVKVSPGASQSGIQGIEEGYLKVRLAAPPVDGKANAELIRLMARLLHLSKSQISIRSGLSSRRKVLHLEHFQEENFRQFLGSLEKN